MSEWWTYRLSDFLLFSPRTYFRLLELHNAALWPAHLVALAAGLAIAALIATRRAGAWPRLAMALLAGCWIWVGWAFHLQRYATINWAAIWFAAAFGLQGLLLLAAAAAGALQRAPGGPARMVGLLLLFAGCIGFPRFASLFGRPWTQAEVFGLAPTPTVLVTLGLLLCLQRAGTERGPGISGLLWSMAWPIPLLWCLVDGATLWTMQTADAPLMPVAGLVAVAALAAERPRPNRPAWR